MIGAYIVEQQLSAELQRLQVTRCDERELFRYQRFYRTYPQMVETVSEGDNLPMGLLLCANKDHALVEYATASMDSQLFVSKYAVELPTKDELRRFLERQCMGLEGQCSK